MKVWSHGYTLCPCGEDHGPSDLMTPFGEVTGSKACTRGFMKAMTGVDYGSDERAMLAFKSRLDQAEARFWRGEL